MRERNGGIRGAAIARVALRSGLAGLLAGTGVTAASAKLQAPSQTLSQTQVVAVKLADMNKDGYPDAVVGDSGGVSNPSQVWLNRGDGTFENNTLPGFEAVQALDVGDVDGDGDTDAWVIRKDPAPAGQYQNAILKNKNGTAGELQDAGIPLTYVADPGTVGLVRLLDYNGDGVLEAVRLFDDPNTKDQPYGNPADDGKYVTTISNLVPGASVDVALGDLDGQSGPDLAVVNGVTTSNSGDTEGLILYESASGSLQRQAVRQRPSGEYTDVALGDVSGNARDDALTATATSEVDVWLVQLNGTLNANPVKTLPATNSIYALAVADIDGDGHQDLIKATGGGARPEIEVWTNTGQAPYFGSQPAYTVATANTANRLAVGDVDNDGDLDLVAGEGGVVQVLLNDASSSSGGGAGATLPIGSGGGGGGALGPWSLLLLAAAGLRRRRRPRA